MRLPDPPKRVVGWNSLTGRRTANSLNKAGVWREMMSDIWGCENSHQLLKVSLHWSNVAAEWPQEWVTLANEKFDEARECLTEMETEKENSNGTTQALWW